MQLEEHYRDGASIFERWNWKQECFICNCNYCGNVFITTSIIRCPCCDSGNICVVPFRDTDKFNLHWLMDHGFRYVQERGVVEDVR